MYCLINSFFFTLLHPKQLSVSNATHVTLRNVGFNLSGNFTCEVTADAPSFYTATATNFLQVVGEFTALIVYNFKTQLTLTWNWNCMEFFVIKFWLQTFITISSSKDSKLLPFHTFISINLDFKWHFALFFVVCFHLLNYSYNTNDLWSAE